jgi:hypothetical protein
VLRSERTPSNRARLLLVLCQMADISSRSLATKHQAGATHGKLPFLPRPSQIELVSMYTISLSALVFDHLVCQQSSVDGIPRQMLQSMERLEVVHQQVLEVSRVESVVAHSSTWLSRADHTGFVRRRLAQSLY